MPLIVPVDYKADENKKEVERNQLTLTVPTILGCNRQK
jgi:hypothetical protein